MHRIVHLGLGNFHRAHQAWYTAHSGDWKITGVIMSNRQLHDHLAAHKNEYVLGIWGKDGLSTETISVYDDVLLATEQASDVINTIADPDTHIVTLTVTEKGYYLRAEDNHLDINAQPVRHDLDSEEPGTAIGLLAAGLILRVNTGAGKLTVLSCDNLADNGQKLRQVIGDYITQKDPGAVQSVLENVAFPNTMVDRITPRLNKAAIADITAACENPDLPIVGAEKFSEWIIADEFVASRPQWESAGVVFVPEVASFEERKLRLLNASHSFLAYAGQLAGHQYVHQAIADGRLRAGVNALWDEAAVTVSKPASDTLDAYRSALLDRFAVLEMRHDLSQIAMDGSMKLRERLVPIVLERAKRTLSSPHTCEAIAAWMAFIQHAVKDGMHPNDPNAEQLISAVNDSRDARQCCEKLAQLIGLPDEWVPQVSSYQVL